MSKNLVDSILDFCYLYPKFVDNFTFIPSRRQIECRKLGGGYVNNWTTEEFSDYINRGDIRFFIERDHSGPYQGKNISLNCLDSLLADIKSGFQIVHIDPWKICKNYKEAINFTTSLIQFCETCSPSVFYEVGTEEAIFPYGADELNDFLSVLQNKLKPSVFDKIVYAVVQTGTITDGLSNIGKFDYQKAVDMNSVCRKYGKLSKEHNADYLTKEELIQRTSTGVNCLNIAPEFGVMETELFIKSLADRAKEKELEQFRKICFNSNKWRRWRVDENDIENISRISGHYVFSTPEFIQLKNSLDFDFNDMARNMFKGKLWSLVERS